ncbi:MAG: urate hydroxylase PuuD [Chloroflexi bacterium]|nr:urate hydroxylase PuuD [Chloroflexota bacterium]
MSADVAAYLGDWLHLLLRWGHLIAAIGWVGTSFYFISLDLGLVPSATRGVAGEAWEIHGGGFYRIEKLRLAPERMPESLRWFKWEAYLTWLTGFALLVLLYYLDPYAFLIDPVVLDPEPWQAIVASVALLGAGWVAYDAMARALEDRPRAQAVAVAILVTVVVLVASALFGSRAAWIHAGATLGTWMAANVLLVIIPGQRELIRQAERGSGSAGPSESTGSGAPPRARPEAVAEGRADGDRTGKQRSVHNNYLTLPVLFAMISQHFPFTYGHAYAPLVLLGLMAAGATAQHFLNLRHQGRTRWPVLGAAGAMALAVAALVAPPFSGAAAAELSAADRADVMKVVTTRCAPCHARAPTQPGITAAPKGLVLESGGQVRANARRIFQQVVVTRVMPLGNQTGMTDEERDLIARWFRSGAPLP